MLYSHAAWLAAIASLVQAGPHVISPPCDNPVVDAASKVIVKHGLQSFCSSILGYTAPTTTTTQTTTVTPTSIYVDIIYATTYYTTNSYTEIRTAYTTNPLQRRGLATQAPLPLKTFPAGIISSACVLAAPRSTVTTTVTSTAPEVTSTVYPTDLQSVISYVPVATATTTLGADCGLISRESLTGQGGSYPDTGIPNCDFDRAVSIVQEPFFYFFSFAIGTRPDGITYCELYQNRKAKQVIAETSSKTGEPNFTFYDRECFPRTSTTYATAEPTSSV